MKIAVIQMNMKKEAPEANFLHAYELLSQAAENGAEVLILPETWNTGFFPKENLSILADKNGEKTHSLLEKISRGNGVYIVGGSVTAEKDGKIFNTCYIYNEKGEHLSSYSKTHLFSPMDENLYYTAGDNLCVFQLGDIKAAVIICYDLRFPEIARKLALSGAEILFVPSQWPIERIKQMEILMKARAVENQMYVVLCNAAGAFNETVFGGHSAVCDPLGNVLINAGNEEEIIYCEISTDCVSDVRHKINVFSDRRTDIY